MYDLQVTGQPTVNGQQVQTCAVGLGSPTAQRTAGSAVLLIDPADPTNGFVPAASATNAALGISKNVRCRANPADQLMKSAQGHQLPYRLPSESALP